MRITAALAALALAGCGAESETTGGTDAEPAEPATSLEVTVWPDGRGNGPKEVTRLECDPAGGGHPAAEEACSVLAGDPNLLEPVPDDVICTQQYGGPEQAAIRGTLQGEKVDMRYSRANGCEIARWDRLAPLFEAAG